MPAGGANNCNNRSMEKRIYLAIYHYDQALQFTKDEMRPAHRDFTRQLHDNGILLATGSTQSFGYLGSLTIMRADSAEQVRELLAEDPYITSGFVKELKVLEWRPVVGEVVSESKSTN